LRKSLPDKDLISFLHTGMWAASRFLTAASLANPGSVQSDAKKCKSLQTRGHQYWHSAELSRSIS
jgi:hypothetical protein